MARPRKILETNKKHFTKAEKQARAASEQAFRVPREQLLDFDGLAELGLSETAIAEFKRIVNLADWLDDLDRNDLLAYVVNYDRALAIVKSPDAKREIMAQMRGDGSKKIIRNPLWEVWKDCTAQMRSISLKLGLSQIDRLKLTAPTTDETPVNKFLQFLRKDV